MERSHGGVVVGYGDDVLQMIDAIAATEIGRHRQVEALLDGDEDVDRPLLVDECELVMGDESLPAPVRACAAQVLRSLGIDPDTIRTRVDAGCRALIACIGQTLCGPLDARQAAGPARLETGPRGPPREVVTRWTAGADLARPAP